jgi:hypothetical protein
MNQTVLDDVAQNAPKRAGAVISGRALLLRAAIAVITVVTMSIGGAWLMHAAIDPAADAIDGATAPMHVDASDARPGAR